MTVNTMPNILTPKEVADYLKVAEELIIKEFNTGNLKGFKVGTDWRITDVDLMNYIKDKCSAMANQAIPCEFEHGHADFKEIGEFDYQWPLGAEHFEIGYETTKSIGGRQIRFRIGFGEREAAGKMRRRVIIWMDERPLVEFAGGNDFKSDGILASIIKLPNNKQLTPYQSVPQEYKDFQVRRYNSIVKGPRASKNMAIIVHKDDLDSMLRHAVIRANWKQLI